MEWNLTEILTGQLIKLETKKPTRMEKGGRLAQASRKLTARRALYATRRAAFLLRAENFWCPVAAAGVMLFEKKMQRATQVHHKDGREGMLLLDESLWLAVSQAGHDWIHQHPNAARQHGWLI